MINYGKEKLGTDETDDATVAHKALVNECIVNALLQEPSISQEIKDKILFEGTLKAEDYRPNPVVDENSIGELITRSYLRKENTDATRNESFYSSINEYAETGDKLTQDYIKLGGQGSHNWFRHSGIKKKVDEKKVTLVMAVAKGFLCRPLLRKFYMNPCTEAIIEACIKQRNVWTTSDPSFVHKGIDRAVQDPITYSLGEWEKVLSRPNDKIIIYSIYPSPVEDLVEIAYALV